MTLLRGQRARRILWSLTVAMLVVAPQISEAAFFGLLRQKLLATREGMPADLQITKLTVDGAVVTGTDTLTAKTDLSNGGPGTASSITLEFRLLKSGSTTAQTIKTLGAGTLTANGSSSIITTVGLPSTVEPGIYSLIANASSTTKDNVPSNNVATAPLEVKAPISESPTSDSPTTESPTTEPPTSESPTSEPPTSEPSPIVTCTKYQSFFDSVHQSTAASLDGMAASGDGPTYYTFSYPFDGILGMFEGTRDPKYLEKALAWGEQMVAGAKIIDIHGKRNWKGTWNSPYASTPITHQLYEFQGTPPLARLARIVLSDSGLKATYGTRAQAIYRFVKDHIVDKWLYARSAESSIRNQALTNRAYPDTVALFALTVVELTRIDTNPAYLSLARDLLAAFTARLEPYSQGSLIWDIGDSPEIPGASIDTAHANRFPYMAAEAYISGIVVTRSHVEGLARLLTDVIWDQSLSSPQFTNLIDGTNPFVFGRPPYGNGLIYSGWATLGAHDSRARMVVEATLKAIIAGVRNPSLDYNSTSVGKMALSGHVTRNMRVAGVCG